MKNSKMISILAAFNKGNLDPKTIAKDLGFDSYEALKKYMSDHGYQWDVDHGNYINNDEKRVESTPKIETSNESVDAFIMYLYENKALLKELLATGDKKNKLPHYNISGNKSIKSFYMSDKLSTLITDFSDDKNRSQKAIVEAALVDYLRKYGYKKEIDYILQ